MSDTLRIDVSSFTEPRRFRQEDLPISSHGVKYFVLEGSLINLLLTFEESVCSEFPDASIEALLIRTNDIGVQQAEIPDEYHNRDIPGAVWLGGVYTEDQWVLFPRDHLLWDLSSPLVIPVSILSLMNCSEWLVNNEPYEKPITVPAGTFDVQILVRVEPRTGGMIQGPYDLFFTEGVGFTKISELELLEAHLNGCCEPPDTAIQPTPWGAFKFKENGK